MNAIVRGSSAGKLRCLVSTGEIHFVAYDGPRLDVGALVELRFGDPVTFVRRLRKADLRAADRGDRAAE